MSNIDKSKILLTWQNLRTIRIHFYIRNILNRTICEILQYNKKEWLVVFPISTCVLYDGEFSRYEKALNNATSQLKCDDYVIMTAEQMCMI